MHCLINLYTGYLWDYTSKHSDLLVAAAAATAADEDQDNQQEDHACEHLTLCVNDP